MNKRKLGSFALCAMLALCFPVWAQQPGKVHRIGYLAASDAAGESARSEEIRLALRELNYIEGQNIAFEYRYAEGKVDRLPDLAAELVRSKVDIIIAVNFPGVQAAKNATKTTPIVMVNVGRDPVEGGLVESLAHPGGNVTGISNLGIELGGKRLELLKEAVTKITRVADLYDPANPGNLVGVKELLTAARTLDDSALGGTRRRRFREGFFGDGQAAPRWTLRTRRTVNVH